MKKIDLGFEYVETVTIDDVDYVKLSDVSKIAEHAYGTYLCEKFHNAMNDVKLVCDSNKGVVYVEKL